MPAGKLGAGLDRANRRRHLRAERRADWDCDMKVADAIRDKLAAGLDPVRLEVIDESHLHAGHAEAREGGESHFRVEIASAAFAGKSRLERQRLVYELLSEELAAGLHALAMTTLTPEEDGG